uniref:ZZ-type domain-containing protein n=1 Tax=Macrostomum lignano TaxID=282301 RepID=A0A1I8FBI6_9PLAT
AATPSQFDREQTPELERLASELRSRRPELDSVLADAEQQQQTGFLDNRLNRSIGQLDRRFRELESRIDSHSESLRLALHGLAALEDTARSGRVGRCSGPTRSGGLVLCGLADPSPVMSMRSAIEHRCGLLANLREQQQTTKPTTTTANNNNNNNNNKQQRQSLVPNVMTASYASMTGSVHSVQQQQQQQHQQTAHPAVSNSVRPPCNECFILTSASLLSQCRHPRNQLDHPIMAELMQSLTELNYIRYAAYRTAAKLRRLQRALYLDLAPPAEVFRDHGIGTAAAGDRLIDVSQMTSCLAGLFARCRNTRGGGGSSGSSADAGLQAQTIDLSLNWLLNVYDHVRSGRLRVLSFKVGLVLLCAAGLEDKYRYLFSAVVDERGALDQRRLGLLLHDCMQVPRHLAKPPVSPRPDCPRADSRRYRRMPRDLHRQLANELRAIVDNDFDAESQARCSSCKAMPMRGLRYKCLKCFNLNLCQQCFFSGRSARHHKVTHPMQEYVDPTPGSGDGIRSLSRTLRNKLRIGGGSGGHGGGGGFSSDLGDGGGGGATAAAAVPRRLAGQAGLPARPDSPRRPGHRVAGRVAGAHVQPGHANRVEAYASRLAEVEQQQQQRQDSQKMPKQPPPPPASPLPHKNCHYSTNSSATNTTQPLQHSFPADAAAADRPSPQQQKFASTSLVNSDDEARIDCGLRWHAASVRQNAAATTARSRIYRTSSSSSQHFSLPPDRTEQMKELEAENKRLQRQRQQQHLQVASPLTPVRSLGRRSSPPHAAAAAPPHSTGAATAELHKGRLEAGMALPGRSQPAVGGPAVQTPQTALLHAMGQLVDVMKPRLGSGSGRTCWWPH